MGKSSAICWDYKPFCLFVSKALHICLRKSAGFFVGMSTKVKRGRLLPTSFCWCEKRDLNPYGVNHTPLKRARLPIPPLSRATRCFRTTSDIISNPEPLVNPFFEKNSIFLKLFFKVTFYTIFIAFIAK